MAYIECPKCGQRALSIATQCPRCGQEFLSEHPRPLPEEPQGPKLRVVLAVAGALLGVLLLIAALIMIVVVKRHSSSEGLGPPPVLSAAPDTAAATAKGDTASSDTAARDTVAPARVQARVEAAPKPRDTTPPRKLTSSRQKTAPKVRDSTVTVAPAPAPTESVSTPPPPAPGGQEQRYAKDWVNVRSRRRPGARIVRILDRGQAVMVDSLSEGWWRVSVDGKAVGYVYRGYLDTVPPRRR